MNLDAKLSESELWLLSFYRMSEIGGALFFGRLAKTLRPGPIQVDMTKHFADEAQHAWLWTECMSKLGAMPLALPDAYQDQYAPAMGIPANLMEVLALTHVFEKRVVGVYARHANIPGLNPVLKETLTTIMKDERWHLDWIRKALDGMTAEYGAEAIDHALDRFTKADEEVYRQTLKEHDGHLSTLMKGRF